MSPKSLAAGRWLTAIIAALAGLTASTSSASAAKLTLTYQCTYPLIGEAPLKLDVTAAIPAQVEVGSPVGEFAVDAVATASGNTYAGINLIGAVKIEGTAVARSTVALPGGTNLPVTVPVTVARYDVPTTPGDLILSASGKTPSLSFPNPGAAKITVDSIALSLKATKADGMAVVFPGSESDSDKDPNTFDVSCRLDPTTQDTALATFTIRPIVIYDPLVFPPGAPEVRYLTPTTARLSWAPAQPAMDTPVGYEVVNGSTVLGSTVTSTTTVSGLTPDTTYTLSVRARTRGGGRVDGPATTFRTPAATPGRSYASLHYECAYPLTGFSLNAPVTVDVDIDIPENVTAGTATAPFPVHAIVRSGGNTYQLPSYTGLSALEGTATLKTTFMLPGRAGLPVTIPLAIGRSAVPETRQDTVMNGSGATPSLTFPEGDTSATIAVDQFSLSLKGMKADGSVVLLPGADPETDSDGDPTTFDVPCRLDSTPNPPLATFRIRAAVPATSPPPTTSEPTTPGALHYDLAGTATLKSLVRGTLPLSGSLVVPQIDPSTGAFSASLGLNPTQAKLVALGFLPIVADVQIAATQPVTGTLKSGAVAANAVVRIKLPSVSLFGLKLAGGAACQASKPSNIALASAGSFDPLVGGRLTGTFAISDLTGCGFLNGLVSPLTAGKGNAIGIKLTKH